MTPDTSSTNPGSTNPGPTKKSSLGLWLRYGFIAILIVALGVLTGLLIESRSEAKSNTQSATEQSAASQTSTDQTSTQDWLYANASATPDSASQSSDAGKSAQVPAEVAALPAAGAADNIEN